MSTRLSQAAFDGLLEKATVRLRDELLLELSQQLRMTTPSARDQVTELRTTDHMQSATAQATAQHRTT